MKFHVNSVTTLRDMKEICTYTQREAKGASAKLSESIGAREDIHNI